MAWGWSPVGWNGASRRKSGTLRLYCGTTPEAVRFTLPMADAAHGRRCQWFTLPMADAVRG